MALLLKVIPVAIEKEKKSPMFQRHSLKELSAKSIFNTFMEFLGSSMWNIPTTTFLEHRSVVFDRDQGDPLLYKEIHEEYGSMVDALIEGFCDDINIKAEQLVSALKHQDNNHKLSAKERSLLEPVVAAQNFNVFVPMMMRKNVELQLQAVEMIEFFCGAIPAVLCVEGGDLDEEELSKALTKDFEPEEYDRYILVKVLRKSKADFEKDEKYRNQMKMELNEAMKASLWEKERLEERRLQAESAINKALTQTADSTEKESPTAGPEVTELNAPKQRKKLSKVKDAKRRSSETKEEKDEDQEEVVHEAAMKQLENKTGKTPFDINALLQEPAHIPEDDIKARAAYFREQRDKMLRMKRAMREQQFRIVAESTAKERPQTAKAACGAMSGKVLNPGIVGNEIIEARRTLAAKLKNEVKEVE